MAQRIEALSLCGSRWALSEDSGFKSYPSQRFTWSKTWCDRQQLWKAVITGDTVTRLSIPIRGRGKSPEEGEIWPKRSERRNKTKTTKMRKKLILRLRNLISKWFQLKTSTRIYLSIHVYLPQTVFIYLFSKPKEKEGDNNFRLH